MATARPGRVDGLFPWWSSGQLDLHRNPSRSNCELGTTSSVIHLLEFPAPLHGSPLCPRCLGFVLRSWHRCPCNTECAKQTPLEVARTTKTLVDCVRHRGLLLRSKRRSCARQLKWGFLPWLTKLRMHPCRKPFPRSHAQSLTCFVQIVPPQHYCVVSWQNGTGHGDEHVLKFWKPTTAKLHWHDPVVSAHTRGTFNTDHCCRRISLGMTPAFVLHARRGRQVT